MLSDWNFFSRETPGVLPFTLQITGENNSPFPLEGLRSLRVKDLGTPDAATVAIVPKPLLFDTHIELGRIRTIFFKKQGLGFEDQGIFFLSSGTDPLHDEVSVYAVHFTTGSTTVRVTKYASGLHNHLVGTTLATYTVPFSGSDEPIVIEAEWIGGLLNRETGTTTIQVRYGSNTTDFADLVNLTPLVTDTISPIFTGCSLGLFVRSRNSLETINSVLDYTEIYRKNIT